MQRKVKWDRVLVLLLSASLVVLLLIVGIRSLGSLFFKDETEKPSHKDPDNSEVVEEDVESFKIDLVDYEVYKTDEDIDFNFVLARFRLRDPKEIKYNLGSLYTDEKTVKLNEYSPYVDELEKHEYYLGTKNVTFDLTSPEKSEMFTIFIPYKNKAKETLSVYDAITKEEFKFDLTKNLADINKLEYHTGEDAPIETEDYLIKVNDAYIGSLFYSGSEEYTYPSTVQIYVFVLDIQSLTNEGLILEDAIFVSDSGEETHALGAEITSSKINNLMNRKVNAGERGGLFFEMYNPNNSGVSYSGTLKLKFSSSDNWLSVKTELK